MQTTLQEQAEAVKSSIGTHKFFYPINASNDAHRLALNDAYSTIQGLRFCAEAEKKEKKKKIPAWLTWIVTVLMISEVIANMYIIVKYL